MGASASFIQEQFPEDLRCLHQVTELFKAKIALHDQKVLREQAQKTFKKHSKIIDILTSRTKRQLQQVLADGNLSLEEVVKMLGGGNYSKFFKYLFLDKQAVDYETFKSNGKDYNEDALVAILGTSSNVEIALFADYYKAKENGSLSDLVLSRTEKGSHIQKLLMKCLLAKRSEVRKVRNKLSTEQAAELHTSGAAKLRGVDEDLFFSIICESSREQCGAINSEYERMYKIKLEKALSMKFKGNTLKLLNLLIQSQVSAAMSVAQSIVNKLIIDQVSLLQAIAKYDKDFLVMMDDCCQKQYSKSLYLTVKKGLTGNLSNAVRGWIENSTPDGGCERALEIFLAKSFAEGKSKDDIQESSEMFEKIADTLTQQKEVLQRFLADNKIRISNEEMKSIDSLKEGSFLNLAFDSVSEKSPSSKGSNSVASTVYDYLARQFEKFDADDSGLLDADVFWDLVQHSLPMAQFGFSKDEVKNMRQWVNWEENGVISYHDASIELADTIIFTGGNDVVDVIAKLRDEALSSSVAEASSVATKRRESFLSVSNAEIVASIAVSQGGKPDYYSQIPLNLMQYLYDTFHAYDVNMDGLLSHDELELLLYDTNIGLNPMDFLSTEVGTVIG